MFLKIATSELNFCHMKEKQMEKSKTNMTPQSEMFLHLCQSQRSTEKKLLYHHLGCLHNNAPFLYICLRLHRSCLYFKAEKGEDRHARDNCFQMQEKIAPVNPFKTC